MAETDCQQPAALGLAHAANERIDHAGLGALGHMKARHRVAMPGRQIATALRPADDGEDAQALRAQPGALLARREIDVSLGPAARPMIFGAVESGRAEPILQREFARVVDAQAALLR